MLLSSIAGSPFLEQERWLIRRGCGSKFVGTGFESRTGRMLVIEVVHTHSSKLFKGMECAMLSIVHCPMKNPCSYSKILWHSGSFCCHDCAENHVKQYSLNQQMLSYRNTICSSLTNVPCKSRYYCLLGIKQIHYY